MSFLSEQIETQKTLIVALGSAIQALSLSGVESYELDTGQNKQKVTRSKLPELIKAREDALNYLFELERISGVSPSYQYTVPTF